MAVEEISTAGASTTWRRSGCVGAGSARPGERHELGEVVQRIHLVPVVQLRGGVGAEQDHERLPGLPTPQRPQGIHGV